MLTVPLNPRDPEFGVETTMFPLDMEVLPPDAIATSPPLVNSASEVVLPAEIVTLPPLRESPFPTARTTLPPCPSTAADDPKKIWPEDPNEEVPVLSATDPLTPSTPLFAVRIEMSPLDDSVP
jgi:hypothetical protein